MTALMTELEASVDQVLLPVTFGLRAGSMRLAGGRLRYARKRKNRVVFDAPLGEFHSFARSSWGTGFHLWHGDTRYRFAVYHPVMHVELGPGMVADLAEDLDQLHQSVTKHAQPGRGHPLARCPRPRDRAPAATRRPRPAASVDRSLSCRRDRVRRLGGPGHHGDRRRRRPRELTPAAAVPRRRHPYTRRDTTGRGRMDEDVDIEAGLAAANQFFGGLLAGDLAALEAVCAPGSILWINLTEQDRALDASLPAFAALRSKMPDLRLDSVRRRGVAGGFVEQHVLTGTLPNGDPLRVVGCFIGTVANGRITRLEEYVDGSQAGPLSTLLRSP